MVLYSYIRSNSNYITKWSSLPVVQPKCSLQSLPVATYTHNTDTIHTIAMHIHNTCVHVVMYLYACMIHTAYIHLYMHLYIAIHMHTWIHTYMDAYRYLSRKGTSAYFSSSPIWWILFNVIQNLLESWLDSKIPNLILEIPVYQIRRKYICD